MNSVTKPSKDDVHEQREADQPREGVVKAPPRPPAQSQTDDERGDWEGMGQSQHQPAAPPDETAAPPDDAAPPPADAPVPSTVRPDVGKQSS